MSIHLSTHHRISPLLILLSVCLFFLWDCSKDMAEPPEGMGKGDDKEQSGLDSATCDSIFGGFSQDIQPIFTGNCALSGCHDNNTATEGIVLESHGQIMDEVKNGKVLCAIQHEAGCTNMPQGQAQLAAEDIEAIKCWKNAGYPND